MIPIPEPVRTVRQPAFHLPGVVLGLIVLLAGIHVLRVFFLSPLQDREIIWLFSFIPGRYDPQVLGTDLARMPGGFWSGLWSPLTYGFLHGDFTHLGINLLWLAAFGTPLARRIGTSRFLIFTAFAALAGAGAHYLVHPDDLASVIGASAAVSAYMSAVARFMFRRGPAVSLAGVFKDARILFFLGVWFVMNLLFGVGLPLLAGGEAAIAWEAHIGGFLFGLFFFSLFEPSRRFWKNVKR